MKIKERLMVAFLIIITIPVFMISLVCTAIAHTRMNTLEQYYDIDSGMYVALLQIGFSFLLIMCFTATILTLWIYSSILRPLNTLRMATVHMRNGNLDYEVKADSEDEIGELCEDFDKMRVRLKRLLEERLQYEEESRILISNISHDLKTPLTAIKGYSEGILDGVADTPEKMDKYLRTIYAKANDMSSLVDELALYSRIDCDAVPYNFTHLNIEHFFADCVSDLALDLEVKNIEIGYFNYVDKSQQVVADPEQLKRVVNNIVGNSVKYMDKKRGLINIRLQDGDGCVQIELEDNGKGIPPEDCQKIFERFYRADASRNSSQGGTGLGLSIAKKIIEDHGGEIWASGKEGVGTSIFFTLKKDVENWEEDENA
jgi:signal transduction histidine kinase